MAFVFGLCPGALGALSRPFQGGPALTQTRLEHRREVHQRNDYSGALVEFRAAREAFLSLNTENAPLAPVGAWSDPSRELVGVHGAF